MSIEESRILDQTFGEAEQLNHFSVGHMNPQNINTVQNRPFQLIFCKIGMLLTNPLKSTHILTTTRTTINSLLKKHSPLEIKLMSVTTHSSNPILNSID
jgi:hypothetical protein